MKLISLFIIVSFGLLVSLDMQCKAEYLIAPDYITRLMSSSIKLINYLGVQIYMNIEEEIQKNKNQNRTQLNPYIEEALEDFRALNKVAFENQHNFNLNPLNSYILIKKLTKDLEQLIEPSRNKLRYDFYKKLRHDFELPTEEDYYKVIVHLIKLQDVYAITAENVKIGNFIPAYNNYTIYRSLNAFECFEIGKFAFGNGNHFRAYEWLNESLTMLEAMKVKEQNYFDKQDSSYHFELFLMISTIAVNKGGLNPVARALNVLKIDISNPVQAEKVKHAQELIRKDLVEGKALNEPAIENVNVIELNQKNYHLCRYASWIPETLTSKVSKTLFCQYRKDHPYLLIAPVKQECVSMNPPIYIYHNFITVRQMNILINIQTMRELERMTREEPHGAKAEVLSRDEDPLLIYMDNLLEVLIGAKVNHLKQINWEISRAELEQRRVSNVSVLLFLHSSKLGGEHVFPFLNLRVEPVERSCLIWSSFHNLSAPASQLLNCPITFGTISYASTGFNKDVGRSRSFALPRIAEPKSQCHAPRQGVDGGVTSPRSPRPPVTKRATPKPSR